MNLVPIQAPNEFRKIVDKVDPLRETIVVADLRAKLEIQKQLFQKYKCIPERAVLRAAEIWNYLFEYSFPEYHIVSRNVLQTQLAEMLKQEKEEWLTRPGVSAKIIDHIEVFLPVLMSLKNQELLLEWFSEKPNALVRWGQWYLVAKKYFEILVEKKWIPHQWIPAMLSMSEAWHSKWQRNLYLELGTQVSHLERELFKIINLSSEVKFCLPSESSFLSDHQGFTTEFNSKEFSLKDLEPYANEKLRRFSTSLAEVKDATAQIRIWLEEGIAPDEILILAPDIEEYWPSLSMYLKEEGVPVNKKKVQRLHSMDLVVRWLSSLKIEFGKWSNKDLETVSFDLFLKSSKMSHSEFVRLFSNIYDENDFNQWKETLNFSSNQIRLEEKLSRDEFLLLVISKWPDLSKTQYLELIVKQMTQEVPKSFSVDAFEWLKLLSTYCSKIEVTQEEASSQGVIVENIRVGRFVPAKKIYILGLVEDQLHGRPKTQMTKGEMHNLHNDLGIIVDEESQGSVEGELLWLLENKIDCVLSASETNFSGNEKSPASCWLVKRMKSNESFDLIESPLKSHWDHVQAMDDQWLEENRFSTKGISQAIAWDLGSEPRPNLDDMGPLKMSVSRLDRYADCPYKFYSESLLKLSSDEALDIDMDRASKGKLDHAILEELTKEPIRFDWSDNELFGLVERSRTKENIEVLSEENWTVVRNLHIKRAKEFLAFEKAWRDKFPKTKTIGREVFIRAGWSTSENKFFELKEGDTPEITFTGKIDRVDNDGEGHAAVIDYKSSASKVNNYQKWLDTSLQLGVYSILLEEGLTELEKQEVWAALYFVIRGWDRSKGLFLEDVEANLFEINSRQRNKIKQQDVQKFYKTILDRVGDIISEVKRGNFATEPKDTKDCFTCHWRKTCRAPHLN